MVAFWIILLLFLLLPSEPLWLLQLVIGCWLISFLVTFGSYLLLILRRIGVLPAEDEDS
jgi:ABC-type transport system involved in cytochrome c biogenesis permease component